jgi:hypothetical protein
MDERGSGGERDAVSALAGSEAERQGGVRLAGTAWPKSDDVAAFVDPLTAGQLENQRLVQRRLGGEVERVEALGLREPGLADTPLDAAPLAVDTLEFAQAQEVFGVIGPVPGRLHRHLLIVARERRQLQGLEMIGEQDLRRHRSRRRLDCREWHEVLAHAAPARSSRPR